MRLLTGTFFAISTSLLFANPSMAEQDMDVPEQKSTTTQGVSYNNATWLSIGANDKGSISGAVGVRRDWIGIEVGGVAEGTSLPSGTLSYTIPHGDFTKNGDYTGGSYGADLLLFLSLDDRKRFLLYGGPGVYLQSTTEVVQSNVTGWYYENGTSTSTTFAGGGGLRVAITPKFEIGAGYHSLRGVQGSIGLRF